MTRAFSAEPQTVLVADDEHNLRRVLRAQLLRDGFEVIDVADGEAALEALEEHHVDVLITDLRMPKRDGMSLLREAASRHPDVPVIMITAHGTVDTAVEALKVGAFDYVTKPFDRDELRHVVAKATKTRALQHADLDLDDDERGRYQIIGSSPPMRAVYDLIERVAGGELPMIW
ncbi:MAG: response regulator [Myxococcota bacterium]